MTKTEALITRNISYYAGYYGRGTGNDNPHKKMSTAYLLWEKGFISGRKDREKQHGQKALSDSH